VEFLVDVVQMSADGFRAQTEAVGDFLVEQALGKQVDDLGLAGGRPVIWTPSTAASSSIDSQELSGQ
jgi:hypothetical protein